MASPASHFAVRNITYAFDCLSQLITCYTNNPTHLYLRWTTTIPQKHIHSRVVRGAPLGTYIDQCFVVYTDLEQNEPNDTYTHTFTPPDWPPCQQRWFYFWGTVNSVVSPSASCIFTYTAPCTVCIYPDKLSYQTSVDGYVQRVLHLSTWPNIHDGLGTSAMTSSNNAIIGITADATPSTWFWIARAKLTFAIPPLPPGLALHSARLRIYSITFRNNFTFPFSFAIVLSPAPPYNNVTVYDYPAFPGTIISNTIHSTDLADFTTFYFDILPSYLPIFIPSSVTALGIQEATYDAPNIEPTWQAYKSLQWQTRSTDNPEEPLRPRLELTYRQT